MKLLIYGDIGGSGGYVRYCKGLLSTKSIPKNTEVWFISSRAFYEKLAPLDENIHIVTHPWIDSTNRILRYLWHLWVYPNLVKKINPDIEFYPTGVVRVYLRKALTIAACHNLLLFDEVELKGIKDKRELKMLNSSMKTQKRSFLQSAGVIFTSAYSKKMINREVPGIKDSTVIENGLDAQFLSSQPRSYNVGSQINLLYVSPYYHYKHQVEVVKAVQLVRLSSSLDIRLNLFGGGVSSGAIKLKDFVASENAGDYVTVGGNVHYKDLIKEYARTDIFIFASSCEAFGITILEAMGARLPIACSDRTGLPEILKDAGVYFNPEDPASIASAINTLITDEDLRKTVGEKAYKYALDYTWERSANQTFNYIQKILADEK